jgi:broad specificity phosphatase PhoE
MTRPEVATRFGLIRHAETVWNRAKRIQGQQDSPLTPEGDLQAAAWGRSLQRLKWDRILASDTGRAVATADRINRHLGLPVVLDRRLRELDWGRWVSRTVAELRAEEGALVAEQERAGWDFRPPGGESRRSQLERSRQALLEAAGRWPGALILVVTHGGVLKSLVHHLSGGQPLATDGIGSQPYRLHWVSVSGSHLSLEGLDDLPTV